MILVRPKHSKDWRTRRDRTHKYIKAFDKQIDGLVEAYMAWAFNDAKGGSPDDTTQCMQEDEDITSMHSVRVVDIFSEHFSKS